jgi:hypothetical protein
MIMHPAEGKGFFHGLHLLNAGKQIVNPSIWRHNTARAGSENWTICLRNVVWIRAEDRLAGRAGDEWRVGDTV